MAEESLRKGNSKRVELVRRGLLARVPIQTKLSSWIVLLASTRQWIDVREWFVCYRFPLRDQFGMAWAVGEFSTLRNHDFHAATDALVYAEPFVNIPIPRHGCPPL